MLNQAAGTPILFEINRRIYRAGYVSTQEWELFDAYMQIDRLDLGIIYLLTCSFTRGGEQITQRRIRRLIKFHSAMITELVTRICKLSLPEKKHKKKSGDEQSENKVVPNVTQLLRDIKTLYRTLSRLYGWVPNQINNLSPAQIFIYLSGGKDGTGTKKMSGEEFQAFKRSRGDI